jgi:alpha-glucosidase
MYQYQFLCGDALLVVPVTSKEPVKDFYLPYGEWYDIYTDECLIGPKDLSVKTVLHQIPVFVRASSILPMQSLIQNTREKPSDTLIIHVFSGKTKNSFCYYEDDGNTFDYRQGNFCRRTIDFDPELKQLRFSEREGSYDSRFTYIKCVFHGFPDSIKNLSANGNPVLINQYHEPLINGLRYLQDIYDPQYLSTLNNKTTAKAQFCVVVPFKGNAFRLEW